MNTWSYLSGVLCYWQLSLHVNYFIHKLHWKSNYKFLIISYASEAYSCDITIEFTPTPSWFVYFVFNAQPSPLTMHSTTYMIKLNSLQYLKQTRFLHQNINKTPNMFNDHGHSMPKKLQLQPWTWANPACHGSFLLRLTATLHVTPGRVKSSWKNFQISHKSIAIIACLV
jgi:hypothetical protein